MNIKKGCFKKETFLKQNIYNSSNWIIKPILSFLKKSLLIFIKHLIMKNFKNFIYVI